MTNTPLDTNLAYPSGNFLYFATPRPEEHGINGVVRIDYGAMQFQQYKDQVILTPSGSYGYGGSDYVNDDESEDRFSNPHSVDRVGRTDKFFVRTQGVYSYDIIRETSSKLEYVKTVPLSININGHEIKYSPRAFGAYNDKWKVQIMSARNSDDYSIASIISTETMLVVDAVYDEIDSELGSTTTGHSIWLDDDHFALIARGSSALVAYKWNGTKAIKVDEFNTSGAIHGAERGMHGEFFLTGGGYKYAGLPRPPFITKITWLGDKFSKASACAGLKDTIASTESVSRFGLSNVNVGGTVDDPRNGVKQLGCGEYDEDTHKTYRRQNATVSFDNTNSRLLKDLNVASATHHGLVTDDGKYYVVPVYDGTTYILRTDTLEIVSFINTLRDTYGKYYNSKTKVETPLPKGLGSGHVALYKELGKVVITNHWSPYITVLNFNFETGLVTLFKHVNIYMDGTKHNPEEKHLMQPHYSDTYSNRYFYTASILNKYFVRYDVKMDKVSRVYIGAGVEQGHS